MATSARTASLLSARKSYSGYGRFGGSTRVLVSSSLGDKANTIAKTTLQTELDSKTKQYNDGVIGNEEMRTYLSKIEVNPLLSPSDKVDVQNKIRDFDYRINEARLEATYKNAPDNSVAKVQAAQTLANYYNQKASGLYADTPAASTALEKAGQWKQVVDSETDQINKKNRAVKRATLFQEVYKQVPNSAAEASEKYQAFTELAQQAANDGDTVAAAQFSAQAQQAYSDYQATSTKETSSANRKSLNDYINTTMNDYKDGKISGEQAMMNLNAADEQAAAIGETSVSVRLNTLAQGIYRDIEKGVVYTGNGAFGFKSKGGGSGDPELLFDASTGQLTIGAPVNSGGSGGSGISSKNGKVDPNHTDAQGPVSLYRLEYDYDNKVKILHDLFVSGELTADEWTSKMGALSGSRAEELQAIASGLSGVDPEALLPTSYKTNGKAAEKKKAGEILKDVASQYQDASYDSQKLLSGQIIPFVEISNQAGIGKGKPIIQLRDVKTLGKKGENYIFDNRGVGHKLVAAANDGKREISAEEYSKMLAEAGNDVVKQAKLIADFDADGNERYYVQGAKKYSDIYDNQGNSIRYNYDETSRQFVPEDNNNPYLKRYAEQVKTQTDTVRPYNSVGEIQSYFENFDKKTPFSGKLLGAVPRESKVPLELPSIAAKDPVKALNSIPGLKADEPPKVVAPVTPIPEGYSPAPVAGVSKPQSNVAQQIQSGVQSGGLTMNYKSPQQPTASKPVTISTQQISQAVKSGGLSQPKPVVQQKQTSVIDQIKKAATGIGTKIMSWFK